MLAVSSGLKTELESRVTQYVRGRVVAHWELNSYHDYTLTGESFDDTFFPLDPVADPRRPERYGLPKASAGSSSVRAENFFPKYRTPSPESRYKYFRSMAPAAAGGAISVPVSIVYDSPANCNTFKVVFEQSWHVVTQAVIEYTVDGTDWVTIGTFSPDFEGAITVYNQGGTNWGTVINYDHVQQVRGFRVTATQMSAQNARVDIIQLSPRLTMNLSDRVTDVSISRERENRDLVSPIGTAAAAGGSVSFENTDRLFDPSNTDSPVNGLLDENVSLAIWETHELVNGTQESVQQGVFYSEGWSSLGEEVVSVDIADRSKLLQEQFTEHSMYIGKRVSYIVKDMLERAGIVDYVVREAPADANIRIPYVWFKADLSVWEALADLARSQQSTFYFDEQGRFVWESRDWLWTNQDIDLRLSADHEGSILPNLISHDYQYELAANSVNVRYKRAYMNSRDGINIPNTVWERTEPLALQSDQLATNILSSSTWFRIAAAGNFDLYSTEPVIANIDGEYMEIQKHPTVLNRFNIIRRGLYGSVIKDHKVNTLPDWQVYRLNKAINAKYAGPGTAGGVAMRDSYAELTSTLNSAQRFVYMTGGANTDTYSVYGTEIVFPVSYRNDGTPFYDGHGRAGLVINNGNNSWGGYHFEITTTQYAQQFSPRRDEVRVWRYHTQDGRELLFGQSRRFDIIPGRKYRLMVVYDRLTHTLSAMLNGTDLNITSQDPWQHWQTGRYGVFVRGNTKARFEHIYAINRQDTVLPTESEIRVLDYLDGGFNEGFIEQQWTQPGRRRGEVLFDDFGPWVHEAQEFNVDYDISPNIDTSLFISNTDKVHEVFHRRSPFSSRFVVANKTRGPVVVVGDDPMTDTQMSMFVYGLPIVQDEAEVVKRLDAKSVSRRGIKELDVESNWIQTKAQADRIADWLVGRWGTPNDVVSAIIMLDPRLQLGDLVALVDQARGMDETTHRYFIAGINKSFGNELSMEVTLVRARF